jgi:hypothetical protein
MECLQSGNAGEKSQPHSLIINWGVVFGDVVTFVFVAQCPVVSEFFLTDSVPKPVLVHVHGFKFLDDIVVDDDSAIVLLV